MRPVGKVGIIRGGDGAGSVIIIGAPTPSTQPIVLPTPCGPLVRCRQCACRRYPLRCIWWPVRGSSIIYEGPGGVVLVADRGAVGMVAVHAPADALQPVHTHNAAPGSVGTREPHVPQVRGNRDVGAPWGRGPANARLGHRPHRAAAAARRIHHGKPRAGPASPSPLTRRIPELILLSAGKRAPQVDKTPDTSVANAQISCVCAHHWSGRHAQVAAPTILDRCLEASWPVAIHCVLSLLPAVCDISPTSLHV
jgi:hypothetical protein